MLLSVRELLVRQRTQLVNALRGHAAEMGLVAARREGPGRVAARSPRRTRPRYRRRQNRRSRCWARQTDRLEMRRRAIDTNLMRQHKANPVSRRLSAIPGIGPIGALSLALRVDAQQFASARHFAAWLGLVPRKLDRRQAASGRHQPGRRRAAAAIAGARRDGGHSTCQARPPSRLSLAAEPADPQAAQACRGRLGKQNGPYRVGHDDERTGLPASARGRLSARLPRWKA